MLVCFGCSLWRTILNENLLAEVFDVINIYAYVRMRGGPVESVLEAF